MKKLRIGIIAVSLCVSLCACGMDTQREGEVNGKSVNQGSSRDDIYGSSKTYGEREGDLYEASVSPGGNDGEANGLWVSAGDSGGSDQAALENAGLEILCDSTNLADCYTGAGYYYLTEEPVKLSNGEYGTHLMYMDFATQQEIYLCNHTGCKHDTADCPAVFPFDEFQPVTSGLFVYKDHLYVLSKGSDYEGALIMDYSMNLREQVEAEAVQAVLYQMNLDGTNRQRCYTFEQGLAVEDIVVGGREGIYFVIKKLSSAIGEDGNRLVTSSEKMLVCLDVDAKKTKDVCSLDSDQGIAWKISGCFQNSIVLSGVDYGRVLTLDDHTLDNDAWKELYKNSDDVIAVLDLGTGTIQERYRIDNSRGHDMACLNNMLYISYEETGEIAAYDFSSGEEKTLCTLSQSAIITTLGNLLCCRTADLTSDFTYYFVDTGTGEIHHSPLVNQTLGWSLEFKADLGAQVLVVYDYEATPFGDDSYEITQYKYALITMEDLLTGNANYHPIHMIGRGV